MSWKEFKIGCFYDQDRTHSYAFGGALDSDKFGKLWRREAAMVDLGSADETLRQAGRSKAKREALRKLSQYIAKRLPQLDYPEFRRRGLDLGSGPTESYCKLLTARLKGRGRRWDKTGAATCCSPKTSALACLTNRLKGCIQTLSRQDSPAARGSRCRGSFPSPSIVRVAASL